VQIEKRVKPRRSAAAAAATQYLLECQKNHVQHESRIDAAAAAGRCCCIASNDGVFQFLTYAMILGIHAPFGVALRVPRANDDTQTN